MLTIGKAQWADLAHASAEEELRELMAWAQGLTGTWTKSQHLREAASRANTQAQVLGLATPPGRRLYLHCALLLGRGFEADPLCPWAGEALQHPPPAREAALRRALDDAAPHWTAEELQCAQLVLVQLSQALRDGPATPELCDGLFTSLLGGLRRLRQAGPQARPALRAAAAGLAQAHGLEGHGPTAACLVPLLLFGHAAAQDPLHSWIGEVLRQPAGSALVRARNLVKATRACLATIVPAAAGAAGPHWRQLPDGTRRQAISLHTALPAAPTSPHPTHDPP